MSSIDRRHCLVLGAGLALGPLVARARTSPSGPSSEALAEALDGRARDAAAFGFGGQVVVARGGRILLDRAYGWADRRGARPMTRTTAVGIASMTKQFSAAAVMTLKEAGRLSLDAPIGRWLPQAPPDKAALTLAALMSHTAGVQPGDLSGDFELDKAGVLERVYRSELLTPGTWRYSNAGYNLVAAVIEAASGMAYEDYLTQAVFRPAGLRDTGFPSHASLDGVETAHAYRGWQDQGDPGRWPRRNYRPWGGGTALSTAADIFRWQTALEAGRLLSPASVADLVAVHAQPNPRDPTVGYAYGAFVERGEHGRFIERSGDWERGYNAAWHRWPDEDLTLIVVANGTTASGLSMRQLLQLPLEQIVRGQAPSPQQTPGRLLDASDRTGLAGRYPTTDGAVVLLDDGAYLWAVAEGQTAVELLQPMEAAARDGVRAAMVQSLALYAALRTDLDAYPGVLEQTDAATVQTYRDEWHGVVAGLGPLERVEVLGAVPRGSGAVVLSRLHHARGETLMTYLWADKGAGKLVGSTVDTALLPSLVAFPVQPSADAAGLVTRVRAAPFVVEPGDPPRLRFTDPAASVIVRG